MLAYNTWAIFSIAMLLLLSLIYPAVNGGVITQTNDTQFLVFNNKYRNSSFDL